MYFSGKITNSALALLSRHGSDQERLYELTEGHSELLRDPSCWLDAQEVEDFLATLDREYGGQFPNGQLVTLVGHSCHELRAWGVLDSVLRMMQKPQDIYSQPHRFISYFVSPAPPIAHLQKETESISFDLPISDQEFPLVTEYLRAALEALPLYVGKQMAVAEWNQTKIQISWSEAQDSFLSDDDLEVNYKPELMQSLVGSLETAQRELEEKKKELILKDQEIDWLKAQMVARFDESFEAMSQNQIRAIMAELKSPLERVHSHVMRLNDYVARAQQLVTLLVGQNRMDRQVREAMRRMDWEYICNQYPTVVRDAVDELSNAKKSLTQMKEKGGAALSKEDSFQRVSMNLNEVVGRVIARVEKSLPETVQIDRLLFLDRPVTGDPTQLEKALMQILEQAAQSVKGRGRIRVVTRPKGSRVEIEVSDTGCLLDDPEEVENSLLATQGYDEREFDIARSIVKTHQGHIDVSSRKGEGSTYVINLPS